MKWWFLVCERIKVRSRLLSGNANIDAARKGKEPNQPHSYNNRFSRGGAHGRLTLLLRSGGPAASAMQELRNPAVASSTLVGLMDHFFPYFLAHSASKVQ